MLCECLVRLDALVSWSFLCPVHVGLLLTLGFSLPWIPHSFTLKLPCSCAVSESCRPDGEGAGRPWTDPLWDTSLDAPTNIVIPHLFCQNVALNKAYPFTV